MLIYNKKLSVSPLTTHIPLHQVCKKINKLRIIKKIKIINNFYKKIFNKNPNIAILGLNPHNFSQAKKSEEKEIIVPAIKTIKKSRIKVIGPIPSDTGFMLFKRYKLDVILGILSSVGGIGQEPCGAASPYNVEAQKRNSGTKNDLCNHTKCD